MINHYFIRHFETEVQKNINPSKWILSQKGRKNSDIFINQYSNKNIHEILSSPENKALDNRFIYIGIPLML